jgi:hypothetical protein
VIINNNMKKGGNEMGNSSVFGTDDYETIQMMYEEMTSRPSRYKLRGKLTYNRIAVEKKKSDEDDMDCEQQYSFDDNDYIVEIKE